MRLQAENHCQRVNCPCDPAPFKHLVSL